jgi:UDPglucose--hexose-1-phosphate uridylyltransferase
MKKKPIIEFRKDIVSGEWILVSSRRRFRPFLISKGKIIKKKSLKKLCPFENPQQSGNAAPVLWYAKKEGDKNFKNWFVQIFPNKYPLVGRGLQCPTITTHGPYGMAKGNGVHEVILFRDHNRTFEKMTLKEIALVFKAYQQRYKMLEKDKCIEYILIFHNHGELAGASLSHPHSQLVALPIIPPDVSSSINGGLNFFRKYKKCVHCTMLDWEKKEKKRIIYQNKHFITLAPYASRAPYEIRIFPIKHSSDFEEMPENQRLFLAESFKDALLRLKKVLKNPDYNFFIHTASARVKNVPYYHWHIEILPRTYKWAGLELGTGIEVVEVSPEQAVADLKK